MSIILKPGNNLSEIAIFEIPILLIIFNRPETTRKVFEVIREQKPRYLYVAADGPRQGNIDDIENCRITREEIKVDWECDFHTFYRDDNRGCGYGPAEAISWFFENVEMGIILEDDCLPTQSFFPFCQELLIKYKNDVSIFLISGMNQMIKWKTNRSSYFISNFGHTNGWATWRRAWMLFDIKMKEWDTLEGKEKIKSALYKKVYYDFYKPVYDYYSSYRGNDVWDYQWGYSRFLNGGKTIVPSQNMIKNIGFNAAATHTFNENNQMALYQSFEMKFPLKHPKNIIDIIYDWNIFERYAYQIKRSLVKKVILKVTKMIYAN